MKAKIFRVVLLSAMLCAVLAGCGAAVDLDREVEMPGGLTVSVSSQWAEERHDYTTSLTNLGYYSYEGDGCYVSIGWNLDSNKTPEEQIESSRQTFIDDLGGYDWSQEVIEEKVVEGAQCTVFRYSYTTPAEGGKDFVSEAYEAFLERGSEQWDITTDNLNVLNAMLDTVSLA